MERRAITITDLELVQRNFRKRVGNPDFEQIHGSPLTETERQIVNKWHKEYSLAIMMEAAELMDWSRWKHWSNQLGNKQPIELFSDQHRLEVRAELADLMCFILNFCAAWGISGQDLLDATMEKASVNVQRQETGRY